MEKSSVPVVRIDNLELIDNEYGDQNGNIWSVLKLIEASKKYEPFDLPMAGIDISKMPWKIESIDDFIYHMDRSFKADLEYPIILDDQGIIADGWHRIAKSIRCGNRFIKAIRLEKMPPIDRNESDDDV